MFNELEKIGYVSHIDEFSNADHMFDFRISSEEVSWLQKKHILKPSSAAFQES